MKPQKLLVWCPWILLHLLEPTRFLFSFKSSFASNPRIGMSPWPPKGSKADFSLLFAGVKPAMMSLWVSAMWVSSSACQHSQLCNYPSDIITEKWWLSSFLSRESCLLRLCSRNPDNIGLTLLCGLMPLQGVAYAECICPGSSRWVSFRRLCFAVASGVSTPDSRTLIGLSRGIGDWGSLRAILGYANKLSGGLFPSPALAQ